jgi:aspartyl-tRNA(Asn)/glutamyl-tRNA(Gln) amidotransferase subunit A
VHSPLAVHAAAVGYLTIALEGCSAMLSERSRLSELSVDLQLLLSVVSAFAPDDYPLAQRVRAALRRETAEILRDVDVLALPTTAGPPPIVSASEAASSFVDPGALDSASRFAYVPNLCGLPAGTAPVGVDGAGMPVGLQIIGDAWDEASVLATMGHMERIGLARAKRPPASVDLLR